MDNKANHPALPVVSAGFGPPQSMADGIIDASSNSRAERAPNIMFNMGGGELILVGLAALLLIGPKKLPQVATTLGRWFAQLQRGFDEVKQSVQAGLKDEDVKKEVKNERNTPPQKP